MHHMSPPQSHPWCFPQCENAPSLFELYKHQRPRKVWATHLPGVWYFGLGFKYPICMGSCVLFVCGLSGPGILHKPCWWKVRTCLFVCLFVFFWPFIHGSEVMKYAISNRCDQNILCNISGDALSLEICEQTSATIVFSGEIIRNHQKSHLFLREGEVNKMNKFPDEHTVNQNVFPPVDRSSGGSPLSTQKGLKNLH